MLGNVSVTPTVAAFPHFHGVPQNVWCFIILWNIYLSDNTSLCPPLVSVLFNKAFSYFFNQISLIRDNVNWTCFFKTGEPVFDQEI